MAGRQAIAKTTIAVSSLPGPGPEVHQRHLLRLIALLPLYQLVSTVHALDMFSLAALWNCWTPKQLFNCSTVDSNKGCFASTFYLKLVAVIEFIALLSSCLNRDGMLHQELSWHTTIPPCWYTTLKHPYICNIPQYPKSTLIYNPKAPRLHDIPPHPAVP